MVNLKTTFTFILLIITSFAFAQDSINFKKPVELKEVITVSYTHLTLPTKA